MALIAQNPERLLELFNNQLSIMGRRWLMSCPPEWMVQAFKQRYQLDDAVCQILVNRGIDIEQAHPFLNPTLRSFLPDPCTFKDMEKGIERVIEALKRGEKITILGDYDVDGATSTSLLIRFLRQLGAQVDFYIPDRLKEGYGPSLKAFDALKARDVSLVIIVDAGTTAFEPLEYAHKLNIDVVIIDHHVSELHLPKAHAIINPNRFDETVEERYLAAVGVTFLFCVALNRALRDVHFFQNKPEPSLLSMLDLVALGTVCDVMPLQGLNRAFVHQGLKVLGQRNNVGLKTLADRAGLNQRPESYHLGFVYGPRINAGGRVGQADLGTRLLISHDHAEAAHIAETLHQHNLERQRLEELIINEALAQVEPQLSENRPLVVCGENWHPGVIGIVAGRLKERYSRPVCVITLWDNIGKGSGRGVSGVSLGNTIIAARQRGLLINGGGHDMAAGFTIEPSKVKDFQAFLNEAMTLSDEAPKGYVDSVLSVQHLNHDFIEKLNRLAPYGTGHPKPRFALLKVQKVFAEALGNGIIKALFCEDKDKKVETICFRTQGTPLEATLLNPQKRLLSLIGTLQVNPYNTQIQWVIEDLFEH